MKDNINQEINIGDYFIIPGGNIRYGGLVLELGIVLDKTEKRLKTLITRFDKVKLKPTTKSPKKIMVINLHDSSYLENTEAAIKLQKAYLLYQKGIPDT